MVARVCGIRSFTAYHRTAPARVSRRSPRAVASEKPRSQRPTPLTLKTPMMILTRKTNHRQSQEAIAEAVTL